MQGHAGVRSSWTGEATGLELPPSPPSEPAFAETSEELRAARAARPQRPAVRVRRPAAAAPAPPAAQPPAEPAPGQGPQSDTQEAAAQQDAAAPPAPGPPPFSFGTPGAFAAQPPAVAVAFSALRTIPDSTAPSCTPVPHDSAKQAQALWAAQQRRGAAVAALPAQHPARPSPPAARRAWLGAPTQPPPRQVRGRGGIGRAKGRVAGQ